MLDSIPAAVLVGTALGFLSGLGVGGGSLLMLWLTAVLGMEQQTARAVNLMFFLPAAAVSTILRGRQGRVDRTAAIPAAAAGAAAAGLCAWLSAGLEPGLLRRGFGILLTVIGLWELLGNHRRKKPPACGT